MKSKIGLIVVGLMATGIFLYGVVTINAQTKTDPHTSLIQKIAQKFNLKENDVKTVFDQERTERQTQMQTQMQARLEERLNQAIKDGKITDAQKKLVLDKHNELRAKKQSEIDQWQNMTPEERRNYQQSQRQTLEDWAKQNNIDFQYFMGGFGMNSRGFGRGMNK